MPNESTLITLAICLLPIVVIVVIYFAIELIIRFLSLIFPSVRDWRSRIRKEEERTKKIKNSHKNAPQDILACHESRFHDRQRKNITSVVHRKYLVGKWEYIDSYSYTTTVPSNYSNDDDNNMGISVRKTVDVYNFDTKTVVSIHLCRDCIRKGYRLAPSESSFEFIENSGCIIPLFFGALLLGVGPLILFRNQTFFQDLMNEFFSSLLLILIPILGVLFLLFMIKKVISKRNSAIYHASCEILSEFYPNNEYLSSNQSRKKEITR